MQKKSASLSSWLPYLLPALLIYTIFMAFPLIDSLRLSLYSGNTMQSRAFVGFENFARLFGDERISVRYWGPSPTPGSSSPSTWWCRTGSASSSPSCSPPRR